jgi:hypothetical protein
VAAVFTSTNGVPIIVERAMYRHARGQIFGAGHAVCGAPALSQRWTFAEGATGAFFDEFLLLANPGDTPAVVEATYQLRDGATVLRTYTVPAQGRFTVYVDADPALLAGEIAVALVSVNGVPFVAERAMYWPGSEWYEGHASFGATETGEAWGIGEGRAGGPAADSTYVLVANASAAAGTAKLTLVFDDGSTAARMFPLVGHARLTIDTGSAFPEATGRRFSVLVESVGPAPVPLTVEWSAYSSPDGVFWSAGATARATTLR